MFSPRRWESDLAAVEKWGRGVKISLWFMFFLLLQLSLSPLFLSYFLLFLHQLIIRTPFSAPHVLLLVPPSLKAVTFQEELEVPAAQTEGLNGWTGGVDGSDDVSPKFWRHGGSP